MPKDMYGLVLLTITEIISVLTDTIILNSILLISGLTTVFAQNDTSKISIKMRQYLESEQLPIPYSGIKIVEQKNTNKLTKSTLEIRNKAKLEIKQNGYYTNTKGLRASELLNLKNADSPSDVKQLGVMYTGYRKHSSELKISFPFDDIKLEEITNVIGYAPEGAFDKKEGWSGAVAHFETNFGSCSLTKSNMHKTGMSAIFSKDDVTYDINNKITIAEIYGSKKTKFLYSYIWFDKDFYRNLECASETFSKSTKNKVLSLAKELDKQ